MRFAVLDLEMNQPSGTIIQIGAVVVDTQKGVVEENRFDEFLNPGELPSKYISALTGITLEDIENASPSRTVYRRFWKWLSQAGCGGKLAAWGDDISYLIKETQHYSVKFNTPKAYDLKQFVNLYTHFKDPNAKYKMGLKASCAYWGIEMEGRHHNAYWDALNTGKLFLSVRAQIGEE